VKRFVHFERLVHSAHQVSWHDIATMMRMTCVGLTLPILLRCLSLVSLLNLLGRNGKREPRHEPDHYVRLVQRLLKVNLGPLTPKCLTRSLILYHVLRHNGYPVTICFGVRDGSQGLGGHAWLELGGRAVAEEDDPRQTFTVSYHQG